MEPFSLTDTGRFTPKRLTFSFAGSLIRNKLHLSRASIEPKCENKSRYCSSLFVKPTIIPNPSQYPSNSARLHIQLDSPPGLGSLFDNTVSQLAFFPRQPFPFPLFFCKLFPPKAFFCAVWEISILHFFLGGGVVGREDMLFLNPTSFPKLPCFLVIDEVGFWIFLSYCWLEERIRDFVVDFFKKEGKDSEGSAWQARNSQNWPAKILGQKRHNLSRPQAKG